MNRFYDDEAAIRAAGYALVDEVACYLTTAAEGPVTSATPPTTRARSFAAPPPARGRALPGLLERLRSEVVDGSNRLASPMYMGHQVCPPLPVAALADALVSALNQSLAVWEMSPAATLVELGVVRWATGLVGWDAEAGGSFVSGGSAANLAALLAARARRFPAAWREGMPGGAAIVTGKQAHYSVARAAGILGMGADAVIAVDTTPQGATDPRALAAALEALEGEGREVVAVVATAGSTATGSFDDLPAIAALCRPRGIWLHVDGAHGASALLSAGTRHRLRGLELADSLAWDPHKMMFMPLSTAMVLARRRRDLERAFQQDAPYLFHAPLCDDAPPDTGAWTLQCSRRADALRLRIALEYYGTDAIGQLFDHTVALARALHERLDAAPDFEPLHRPECNILCFRHTPAGVSADRLDAFQDRLRAAYNASGKGWITAATVGGRRTLRVTLINPRTEERHLDALIKGLREVGARLVRE